MVYRYYNHNSGKVYDNRYDAIIDNIQNRQTVLMYYRDDEYDKINWKIEPNETLKTLYKRRAEQIRNDYDYVVLCYSGGIDSTNMLESFYYNNIHIDEIVSIGSFSQDQNTKIDENHNKEIYDNVIPNLNRFNLPNTKKTVIDYTEYFRDLNNFSLYRDYGDDYYKYVGAYPSITYLFWYDLGKFLKLKKKSAIVYGAEKPYINISEDGRFCTNLSDSSIAAYSRYGIDGESKLNFYSDPEASDIMRKQLHLIKNFYFKNVIAENKMTPGEFFETKNYLKTICSLVYDVKNPLVFIGNKSSSQYFSVRDTYIKSKTNSDIFGLYAQALKKIVKSIPINTRHSIYTKKYFIT